MEKKVLLVCCVAGLLGLLSAATGFGAEATRIKGSQVQFVNASQCEYPRTAALGLGFTAAVALMVAHIIINVSTGCICCKRIPRPSNSNWTVALICFVVSWFSFVIAFLLLLTGSALNDRHGVESMYFGSYYCYVVKPGVFAGGAVLSLASVTLGIFYYMTLNSAKNNDNLCGNAVQGPAIAMGQPQFPAQNNTQDPVFVHEDTYMRRQFT
ncbi:protein VASCULATURE COMPLEXITY AND CONNECTIVITY [Rosa rugosa]|uniref:protein VASCULATURE COMPLEXITY AND CONNECTIVITY n=1 Tax=Rosa rugosa TaxID=74645 RepID=UPI002B40C8A7|nr:protein VASCULATURE COMPLEXITY AND CONNECTIVITY [Rosa rugosa]